MAALVVDVAARRDADAADLRGGASEVVAVEFIVATSEAFGRVSTCWSVMSAMASRIIGSASLPPCVGRLQRRLDPARTVACCAGVISYPARGAGVVLDGDVGLVLAIAEVQLSRSVIT